MKIIEQAMKPKSDVFLMDCQEGMKQYPDGYFDLAICDPEYGINIAAAGMIGNCNPFGGKKSFGEKNTRKRIIPSKDYGKKKWDKNSVSKDVLDEIIRVSKNQIIWGANHFISKLPYDSPCWIVWDKDNSGNYADCELAWTSFRSVVKRYKFRWNGMLQENMSNKEDRIHPTQKPVSLYKWLLHNYAKPGDKILDSHMGSQSSRIAAYQMGFDYTGFEIDPEYFEAGCKRFKEQTAQQSLFDTLNKAV